MENIDLSINECINEELSVVSLEDLFLSFILAVKDAQKKIIQRQCGYKLDAKSATIKMQGRLSVSNDICNGLSICFEK